MQKENGEVIGKLRMGDQPHLHFSYRVGGQIYDGTLAVTEAEFRATGLGDRISIYYDVDQPWQRSPTHRGWDFWLVLAPHIAFLIPPLRLFYCVLREIRP